MLMTPNILLVILDSVRAKNVGLYDHARDTMPFLSEFANESTVYEQARTAGSRSITGHASLLTGLNVEEHGLTNVEQKLQPGTTIFDELREAGYETGVFSENIFLTQLDVGLKEGFDTVVGPQNSLFPEALDARRFVAEKGRGNYGEFLQTCLEHDAPLKSLANGAMTKISSDFPFLSPSRASQSGDVYLERFLEWQAQRSGPWAACLNLMDAHHPYEPKERHNLWGDEELEGIEERRPTSWELVESPKDWWRLFAVESLYDGAIHQLDALLERLVSTLENRDALEDTLVVITSDHGEGFGEPSRVRPGVRVAGHNTALHEVILHVPHIVRIPGQQQGERISRLSTLTAFPSIVESVRNGDYDSRAFVREEVYATSFGIVADAQLRARAERYLDDTASLDEFNERLRAVYEDKGDTIQKKLAWGDRSAVTIEIHDAQNSYVVSETEPSSVDEHFSSLENQNITTDAAGIDAVEQETKQRLEDLGYV